MFLRDKDESELAKTLLAEIASKNIKREELKDFMKKVHTVKTQYEQANVTKSAKFIEWTFSKIIGELEEIIDEEKSIKHSQIQKKIESLLDNDKEIQAFASKN